MKLGASYNVFDGEELLEASILSIRDNVDYINVVYQTTSNYGEYYDNTQTLFDLKNKGLIDNLIFYEPNKRLSPKQNEINKRNIGLIDCKNNNCSHFMNLDTDEFYKPDELKYAKEQIILNNYNATIVKMIRYYKYPTIQIENFLNGYIDYAPLIYSINYKLGNYNWKYPVDPSRQINTTKIHIFSENEIIMHHMAYVRKNFKRKLINKSTKNSFNNKLNDNIYYHNKYKHGENITIVFRNKIHELKPKIVKNYFNIDIHE